jgi:hypothetical protein
MNSLKVFFALVTTAVMSGAGGISDIISPAPLSRDTFTLNTTVVRSSIAGRPAEMVSSYDTSMTGKAQTCQRSDTLLWDFETGKQGWHNTNGLSFPFAWDVQPADIGYGLTAPDPGDSSLWISADLAGEASDTAWSPIFLPDSLVTHYVKYSLLMYDDAGAGHYNDLCVGIQIFHGGIWNAPFELKHYPPDTSFYGHDSVPVTDYNDADSMRIYYYYSDWLSWGWYAALDNVTVRGLMPILEHDVGTVEIVQPHDVVFPDTVIEPTVIFGNCGESEETFDAHMIIDSAGITLYSEMTTMTVGAGIDTTVVFAGWTIPPVVGSMMYTATAYTVLGTDMNHNNDTLQRSVLLSSSFWQALPSEFAGWYGHYAATLHDGEYLVFGVYDQYGLYSPTPLVYDIDDNSWSSGPDNPYGVGTFGNAFGVIDKYYRIGGFDDNGYTANARVDIYDPASYTWSSGTSGPLANVDFVGGVFEDSLIYTFGGGNWFSYVLPHTYVYFYDVYTDTWTQATSFPGPGRGCLAGGIIDTFAIIACGYDNANYFSNYAVGIIDPADCSNIDWGSLHQIPGMTDRARCASGVDVYNKELWVIGGWTGAGNGETWSYSPYTDVWTNWFDEQPDSVVSVTPIVVTTTSLNDLGVFVCGGELSPTTHGVFHTLSNPGVEETIVQQVDRQFGFCPRLANPVRGYSIIAYSTTQNGRVTLKIFDNNGRIVRTLVDRVLEPPGAKSVYWDGKDNAGTVVPSGIYFLQLQGEGTVHSRKLVFLR